MSLEPIPNSKIYVSHYRLRARGFLNSVSARREFDGVLIRAGEGFGCIHPWPELGDPTLEKCLDDLRGARRWPIVRRALRCAEYDEAAREHSESLFEDMEVPISHATLTSLESNEVAAAVDMGFTTAKAKCGRNLVGEVAALKALHREHPTLRWRLDFNETGDAESIGKFLYACGDSLRGMIDFIEDPLPFSETAWPELHRKTRVPLAVDREAGPHRMGAQVVIIKPAIDEPFLLAEVAVMRGQRIVLTSYMDHPLGQTFAAWEAARLGLLIPGTTGICGLQTHHLFQPNPFIELLGPWKPEFKIPGGTGLGFDDLLDELPWAKL